MATRHGYWRWLNGLAGSVFRLALVISILATFAPLSHAPKPAQAQPGGAAICNSVTEISNAECQALMALFVATNGPAWTTNTGWGQTTTPCTWFGVSCSPVSVVISSVTTISLANNRLTGNIPTGLLSLPNLQRLYLNDNQLTGPIPPEVGNLSSLIVLRANSNQFTGDLPRSIESLRNLQELNLSNNPYQGRVLFDPRQVPSLTSLDLSFGQLQGELPNASGLIGLTYLGLHSNVFTGTLEGRLTNLPNLQRLYVNENQLTGPIPPEVGNLISLTVLRANSNQFTGDLPRNIENLRNLQELNLSNNPWRGRVLFDPRQMSSLTALDLSSSQLQGELPNASGLIGLTYLGLHSNVFTGTLEGRLTNLPNLQRLYVNENRLTGSIPPEVGNLISLTVLRANSNQFTGDLPRNIENLRNLQEVNLSNNPYQGRVLFDPRQMSSLTALDLSSSQLQGELPNASGLISLTYLALHGNAFTGTLEGRLTNLPNLQFLYLNNNQLTGSIPPEIGMGNLRSLQGMYLFNNQLTGRIPTQIGDLLALRNLYLYRNQLTGPIPPEIGDLTALEALRLNNNQLSGPIPASIGNLSRLRSLDLHFNYLTGVIPPDLGKVSTLQDLHLHWNLLEGNLPSTLNQLTNLGELEVYQNLLTGPIPDLSNLKRLSSLRLDSNRLTGTIPATLGALSNLGVLYLQVNRLTGTIPKELGELVNLRRFSLDYNALEGEIPNALAKIGSTLREISPTLASDYSANYNNLSTNVSPGVNWLLRRYNPVRGTFTWQETQTRPPDNVRARQIGGNLLVTWDALPLQLTNYQVTCDGLQPHSTPRGDRTITSHPFPNVAPGTYTCTVRTFVDIQNTTQQNALLSAPSAPAVITIVAPSSNPNRVFVQDSAGQPVIGAAVVVSRAGVVQEQAISVAPMGEVASNQPIQPGDALIAISQTVSITTPKGLQPNAVTHGYITNLDITPDGAMPYTVTTTGTHALTVTASNPLLVFDLVVSMQWSTFDDDPVKRYEVLRELERAFGIASDHLYDVSDGRMALGSVKIFDDGQFWQDADIHVFANTSLIPNAEVSGTRRLDAYINIRRGWDRKQADIALDENDGYKMLVHELGHYLLGMRDSYEGTRTIMCTTLMAWPYDGEESRIFSMQGLAPWLPDTDEAKRCAKTEQWVSFGVSDWETIIANYGERAGVVGMTLPTRHITATTIASPLSATKVVTYPSGRQIQAVAVRLLTLTPVNPNAIGQPLNATILRPNGQIIDLGPVDRNGNITVTVPFESSDQLLLSTPDGVTTQLLSAAELSGTVAISVSPALANPTVDIGVADGARGITVTVGNVTALAGASALTATVVESGPEDPFRGVMTLTRQTDVYVGSLSFGNRAIKQGDVQAIARTLDGVPVRLVTNFTTDGDGGSHMVGRVPRSPDGKFEMRIPFPAAQLLQNNAFVVSPIRISGTQTSDVSVLSSNALMATDPYPPPPPDLKQIGSLFNIRVSRELVNIPEPMSATLYYDPATLGNLSETQIKIYYLNEQANPKQWEPLPTTLNLRSTVETHSVSATTNRFGIYGLFIKTRYLLQGGVNGPRQNEYVYVRDTAELLLSTLRDCSGNFTEVYSFDNFNPQNPWRKFIADTRPEEAYLNTLSESTPGQAYQIVMKQGTTCTLDFTRGFGSEPLEPGPDPLTLPIVPATAFGRVRDDATEIIGWCADDPQAQPVTVAPTVDDRGRRVFNIDLPVSTREAVTCTLEAKSTGVTITKRITAQSGMRQAVDMSAYNWFFPWLNHELR